MFFHVLTICAATFAIVCIHEFLHWVSALAMKLKPHINLTRLWVPTVVYKNTGEYGKILFTTALPNVVLVCVGIFLPVHYAVCLYVKMLCFIHVVQFLPFTADGRVILLSFNKLYKRYKKSELLKKSSDYQETNI